MKYPSYSVAIRTLGTAGDKYQETLNSILRQTLIPEKVLVYIPKGYAIPKETIGIEEYIRCNKGMVEQRSLPFNEIESDYILFLDDDLSFEADFVKLLFDGLIAESGDCIIPDIYSVQTNKLLIKVRDFLGGTIPHFKKNWSFIIRLDGHYSYNINPQKDVLLSQSGAFACFLCRKSAYSAIHFEDERWLDQFHFGLGDDQLFFYKLYKYGFKLLTLYNVRITHLDAGAGHYKNPIDHARAYGFCRYMIWYRTIYSERSNLIWRIRCRISFLFCQIRGIPLGLAQSIKYHSLSRTLAELEGRRFARQYIHSDQYKAVPSYFEYKAK